MRTQWRHTQDLMSAPLQFRDMNLDDVPAGLRLCRTARWNQLAADWELFLHLSPSGCRVATCDDRVIGTVTTVNYENRFAWIGMVLVDPEYRGRGVGTRLLQESLDILKDLKCSRLDATPQGRAVYLHLNFVDEYQLSRMQLDLASRDFPHLDVRAPNQIPRELTKDDLVSVFEIDRCLFGADRSAVLRWAWLQAPEYAWVIRGDTNEVEAYCFGRRGFNFDQIGPIYSRAQQNAELLVLSCLEKRKNQRIIVDAFHHSPTWIAALERLGFAHQRPFIRMYRGQNGHPGLPGQLWAMFGPEFG